MLWIAYTAVWLAVVGYVARLALRQRRLEKTLEGLRGELSRGGARAAGDAAGSRLRMGRDNAGGPHGGVADGR